ncbi:uncharacterized protein FIBRA_05850 [Fibroporia radiculosa]|uniref:Uncharacterized protein n=1 Tax=Fibroporia radiculosa TaxID=599839 RepID=J4H3R5_9APHY|nr:uncharacterized protein FIBRA_05850 [Fibroporia radiculosa]CCM03704.1 predicted protein [Fibroporia radiculosa]
MAVAAQCAAAASTSRARSLCAPLLAQEHGHQQGVFEIFALFGAVWATQLTGDGRLCGSLLSLAVALSRRLRQSRATVALPPSLLLSLSLSFFSSPKGLPPFREPSPSVAPAESMAVLAQQDWHLPRDHTMDALPSPSAAINPSVPRQRSSPANDQSQAPSPISQQQPYPYPVQQQQAGWTSPQQYYPAFYANQQPYPLHGHSAHPSPQQIHPQNPYYDPANAQFAQWAYQQMMFNAQQAHQMSHTPPHMASSRSRSSTASSGDYFALNQVPGFNPFPSGTPPPHPSQLPNGYSPTDHHPSSPYQGFHPYRRPQRHGSGSQDPSQNSNPEWRSSTQMNSFQPPYARSDAAGSSSSVNSGSSNSGSNRPRANSTQGPTAAASSSAAPSSHIYTKSTGSGSGHGHGHGHGRGGSITSINSQKSTSSAQRPANRSTPSSSGTSPTPRAASTSTAPSPTSTHGPPNLRKPSPLSQGNFTATEKRMSRDDSDLAAMLEPNPNSPGVRSGGLKGRLRRALSLGANATLNEEEEDSDAVPKSSSRSPAASNVSQAVLNDDAESTATVQKKKSRSLFNSRLNRSTDNISLSSTMSSASMVIRKLGSIGKLTRRNSLAGITSLFKDKKDKEDEENSGKKGKKKKGEKGPVAEASVSHAGTAAYTQE